MRTIDDCLFSKLYIFLNFDVVYFSKRAEIRALTGKHILTTTPGFRTFHDISPTLKPRNSSNSEIFLTLNAHNSRTKIDEKLKLFFLRNWDLELSLSKNSVFFLIFSIFSCRSQRIKGQ